MVALECAPPLPRKTYEEFFEPRLRTYNRRRTPINGTIELTRRCNFNCVHCYIVEHGAKGEMTTEEVFRILDEIADAGCLYLLLTGGEILVRPDFVPIYKYAHQKGFILSLYTNGLLIDEALVDVFKDRPPSTIEITLYGATEDTWTRVTRRKGAMAPVLRGIDLLAEAGLPVALKTVGIDLTENEMDGLRALATARSLHFRYDAMIQPRIEGNMAPCAYRLPPEKVVRMEAEDPQKAQAWREAGAFTGGMMRGDKLFDCGAGVSAFHIDSRARLSVCTIVRTKMYDLRQGTFRDGWDRWVPEVINRKMRPDQPCVTCKIFTYCEACPGWAAMETGSEFGHVKHACDVAHLRAEAFPPLPAAGPGVSTT